MITSELVTPTHLARKALIYIRQSTPQQVLTNQESLRLQYALRLRAIELGWRSEDIEIIDADLGQTGAVAQNRQGFKEVVSRVTLGEVGMILFEVTRLSQLFRLVSSTRHLRISQLFNRRSRWRLRSSHDEWPPFAGTEGPIVRI